jgi:hypothetical protein
MRSIFRRMTLTEAWNWCTTKAATVRTRGPESGETYERCVVVTLRDDSGIKLTIRFPMRDGSDGAANAMIAAVTMARAAYEAEPLPF